MPVRPLPAVAATALVLVTACTGGDPADPVTSLFDDFSYGDSADPALAEHGWAVRDGTGGPGVGARWSPANVTFPTVDGQSVLRLTLRTDTTIAGTSQAEIGRLAQDLQFGTFAARVRFTDAPQTGPGGDHLVQSFFAMSSLPDCDPDYSEIDVSEYLPNGGYGAPGPLNTQTTWASTGPDCDDSSESEQSVSVAGWHLLLATVTADVVRYAIDGEVVGEASGGYVPRAAMALAFNHWLLDLDGRSDGEASTWVQDVDYVFAAPDQVLSTEEVTVEVEELRAAQEVFRDSR